MLSFVAAAIIGVAIGILSGMLGIGGGTVMVPLFRLAFGLDPLAATATSLFSIIPTSLAGLSKHLRNGTCIPRIGLICGFAGACASPLGVLAATHSPNWAVMGGTSLVIGYSSITMLRRGIASVRAERAAAAASPSKAIGAERAGTDATASKAAGACAGGVKDAEGACSSIEAAHVAMTTRTVAAMIVIGLIAGFMGGYVGVGGGFIMVPLFISVLGISMREASARRSSPCASWPFRASSNRRSSATCMCPSALRSPSGPCRGPFWAQASSNASRKVPFACFSHRSCSSLPSYWC